MFKSITQKLSLNRILALCFIFLFSLTLGSSFLRPGRAQAANDFIYTQPDNQTIKGPSQPGGTDEVTYKHLAAGYYQVFYGSCARNIRTKSGKDGDTQATWQNVCTAGTSNDITIQPASKNTLAFNWVNSGEIDSADGRKYVADSGATTQTPSIFYQTNADEGKCKDTINLVDKTTARLIIKIESADSEKDAISKAKSAYDYSNIAPKLDSAVKVDGCWTLHAVGITLGNVDNADLPAAGGGGSQQPSCESAGGGALSWAICPVIEMLDSAANWLDSQIQSLLVVPNPDSFVDIKDGQNHLEQAWGRIRNIALIILVPIMLVMVLGTALGFSFLDAYTVRRAMPRLLIAILFISLSWVITSFLVSFTNAIGQSVLGLVTQPFGGSTQSLADLISPVFAGGVSWGGLVIFGGMFAVGLVSLGIILSIALVVVVVLFIGFALLTLRQLLIFGLILLAPLAILSWIFPSNDKLWKLWWDSFSKLLLMFPLIMLIIGVGKAFALIISSTGSAYQGLDGLLLQLMIIVAYVAPYFFIPAAFRAAGGLFSTITGMVNDRGRGLFDRQKKYRQGARAAGWERKGGRQLQQKRADWNSSLMKAASVDSRSPLSKFALRQAARGVGGYNIQAANSARNAAVAKEINDQIATGKDDEIRGLTVDKATARSRVTKDGIRQYESLGGAWINEADVDAGHQRWGKDSYAKQAALSYEMRKAITEEQTSNLAANYGTWARSTGMSENQAAGAWIGAAFENQNQHLEYKYTDWKTGTMSSESAAKYATEVYEKRGSYNMAQMNSGAFTALEDAYTSAGNVISSGQVMENGSYRAATADEVSQAHATQGQVKAIAENFVSRYGSGAGGIENVTDDGEVQRRGGGPAEPRVQTNAPGAAHVAENVNRLAKVTGVYTTDGPPPGVRDQN